MPSIELPAWVFWVLVPWALAQVFGLICLIRVIWERVQEKRKGELDAYRNY